MDLSGLLKQIATKISSGEQKSHDLELRQQLQFAANNPHFRLSSAQRGILNYLSSPEVELGREALEIIETIVGQQQVHLSSPNLENLAVIEPVIHQTPYGFEWKFWVDQHYVQVDKKKYATFVEAQLTSDQFLKSMGEPNQESWLKVGLSNWIHYQKDRRFTDWIDGEKCGADLLRVGPDYFVVVYEIWDSINDSIDDSMKAMYDRRVERYENLLRAQPDLSQAVLPFWSGRGFIPMLEPEEETEYLNRPDFPLGMIYVTFKVNEDAGVSLETLASQVKSLLCP